MNTRFHTILGLIAAGFYIYILLNLDKYFPGLSQKGNVPSRRGSGGVLIVLVLPVFSICCFVYPSLLKEKLSPRIGPSQTYLLTDGVWYILGYLTFLVFWGVSKLIQSANL